MYSMNRRLLLCWLPLLYAGAFAGCEVRAPGEMQAPSTLQKLTDNEATDFHPTWSPDGRMILFDSEEGDSASVRILHLHDLHLQTLVAGDHPYWLPDNQHITTVQYLPDEEEAVSLISLAGDTPYLLTNVGGRKGAGFPSPDGSHIAFLSDQDGDWELYLVPTDGGEARRLTDNGKDDFFTGWSPDGSRIAYQRKQADHWDGFVVRLADGVEVKMTNTAADEGGLRWSPDGSRLVYTAARNDSTSIYVMKPDRSEVHRLVSHAGNADWHQWSPDGTRIAYAVTTPDDQASIFVLDVSTGNSTVLVDHPSTNIAPDWSPDGEQLLFASNRDGDFELYLISIP